MMYIQTRRRRLKLPFSSFLANSFLFFSLHFPLNLNCQTNWKRKEPTHSEGLKSGESSSSIPPHGGDHKGRDEKGKGNEYEVFLSFRGTNTCRSFINHLYDSLVDAGIHVFINDIELHAGEEIGPELFCNITRSKILIPIISEKYTSNKRCLCELAQMLKYKRSRGQMVLPIFYLVEPSWVEYLSRRLGDVINTHKEKLDKMVVKEWEEALREVCSFKGWELKKIDNRHEETLVKIIVRKVMSELKGTFQLIVPKGLVGIDDRVEEIMSLIDVKFTDTRIIGIQGMGGIGKTTLARVLYNKLSSHFEYFSFVANIRETSQCKGIECLQNQLIFDILGSLCEVSNVDEGIHVIKSQFTHKKVLIILDDIDAQTQLNALAGDGCWLDIGSMVIITTREKSILDEVKVDYMYQLKELSSDQSLILFSRHAFRKESSQSDYDATSCDVVPTTMRLPLTLQVPGSFVYGKREEVRKKPKKVPNTKVQETLRINYEALSYEEQQIFLDIACFFIGSSKQTPTYMWDACGFFPRMGIEKLNLMSLIIIDKDGKLMMNDQQRDLGREMTCRENQKEPQKRSRLWIYEEAVNVLDNNKGTSKIEALRLDKSGCSSYTSEQFKELINLRFLQLNSVDLAGDFQNLLPQLRWLQWQDFSSYFAATNFYPKKLVVLNLSWSGISEDWGGWDLLKVRCRDGIPLVNNHVLPKVQEHQAVLSFFRTGLMSFLD